MKTKFFSTILILASFIFLAFTGNNKEDKKFGYIGTKDCGMCHKTEKQGLQLKIWQDSKHAQAYKTLQTEAADKIAAELGHKTKAAETEDCLRCHASGYNVDKTLLGKNFKVEDSVQCETCHGPGSEYKSMKVMKDRAASVAAGLIIFEDIEKSCVKCHNPESPTYVEFKFEEMWAKIKHHVPKQ